MKEAELTNVYVDETSIKDVSNKTNSTKRFVYKFSDTKFAVVKIFTSTIQDEDFGENYRSIKFWINAKEEDVSKHWNTKIISKYDDYVTKDQTRLVEDTVKEFFPDLSFVKGKNIRDEFSLDKFMELGKK